MAEMKRVDATLAINVDVECPHCQEWFDILTEGDIDRDEALDAVLDRDSLGCEKFDRVVECPECNRKFTIGEVVW